MRRIAEEGDHEEIINNFFHCSVLDEMLAAI